MSANNTSIFSFIDNSIDTAGLKQAELFIGLGINRLSFVLFDNEKQQVVQLESFNPNISHSFGSSAYNESFAMAMDQMVKDKNWKESFFKSVKVFIENELYSLVPKDIFEEKEQESFLTLDQDILSGSEFIFKNNYSVAKEVVNVFAIPVSLSKSLAKHFPKAIIKHHISVLLDNLNGPGLFVNIGRGELDIISLNSKIQFCQTFPYQSREDLLYHIMHVTDHLGIDIKPQAITMFGEFDQKGADFQFLESYIGQIKLISKPADLEFSKDPDSLRFYQFFTLLSLRKCES